MPGEREIPSLQEICMEQMKASKRLKTVEGALNVYSKLDSENPTYQMIRKEAKHTLKEMYPMLLDRYGKGELEQVFFPEDLDDFESSVKEEQKIKDRFAYLKGTILEPAKWDGQKSEDGFYPLEALKQGVEWPKEVNPAKREQFLSPDDFEKVFNMSKEDFNKLDKFKRERLKKEQSLF